MTNSLARRGLETVLFAKKRRKRRKAREPGLFRVFVYDQAGSDRR